MATLLEWLVNAANHSITFANAKTKNATNFKSERVVYTKWTVILIHSDYGILNTEDALLDLDERVITTSESSSWLRSPSTLNFDGGVYTIGVGKSLSENVELRRKNML